MPLKLTLLGTGTPVPELSRRGPSQLVEIGNEALLVDCGRSAVDRLLESGYVGSDGRTLRRPLSIIALTHLHSDHITGLPDLLWAGWVVRWWDRPPRVVGPPGTANMVARLMQAFAYDISARERGEGSSRAELIPEVIEIDDGWSATGESWRLTGFRVDHAPVDEAFGFRVEADAGSIVVSGDTRYSENLIRNSQRADLLVHEAYSKRGMAERRKRAENDPRQRQLAATISAYHTPSDEVGRVARESSVNHLVLSHLVFGAGGTSADIEEDARREFQGKITVGADLLSFDV